LRLVVSFTVFAVLLVVILGSVNIIHAADFPEWIDDLISWHKENKISEQDLVNALEFLAKNEIISFDSSEIQNILQKTTPTKEYEIMVTNGVKHLVKLDKIKNTLPKDAIPSIDNPKFVTVSEVDFVSDENLIVGVHYKNESKAYPLSILTWHEIVNDEIGGLPIAVTYCPLCFTNQVFERTINGQVNELGVAGKLYNSNLVMYDRLTDSLWSQAIGLAIKGELTGTQLKRVPFDVMRWSDWKALYPDTLVLTLDTGHARPYSSNPYSDYFKDPRVLFPLDNKDERIPLKEIVLGFEFNDFSKAYRLVDVESKKIINDKVGNKEILIVSTVPFMGRAFERIVGEQSLEFEWSENVIKDKQTNSFWDLEGRAFSGPLKGKQLNRIAYDPGFWFEWAAFHPETEIYGDSEMKNNPLDIEQMARG